MSKHTGSDPIGLFCYFTTVFFHFASTSCDLHSLYLSLKVHNMFLKYINIGCHNEVLHVLGEAE